jgi:amino acid adenylation domain-containing protein
MPTSAPAVTPSLVGMILSQAGKRPEAVAIRSGSMEMDYSSLVSVANEFTAALRDFGMKRDDVIALAADRESSTVALMLAVLQGGAAYLPFDTTYPPARLSSMLDDAKPRFVVGPGDKRGRLPDQVPWLSCDKLVPVSSDLVEPEAGELAYVLFTSGSTGRPKGVAMRTSVVAHLIAWHVSHPRLGLAARTLQFAPLGFDVSFQEIWSTLATGGVLVLPSEAERRDPYALLELIARERIERLFLPYVALQTLAEAVRTGGVLPLTLRDVVTAGEQLRITPAIAALFSAVPSCRLHNHYGPTESHVVTSFELSEDPSRWPLLPSIGRPLPHVRVRIVDNGLNPVPSGVEGELLLGGDCLAAGYIHRPRLTAERFIELEGLSWYRTGDMAILQSDGALDYVGRLDDQIKLDGFRVEPAEIESVLYRHEDVAQAAVIVVTGPQGNQLVAHVASRTDHADDDLAARLRAHCELQLPSYLMPQKIVIHGTLPLTPTGKIDRLALKQSNAANAALWPENAPIEQQLAALWTHLLASPDIDPNANFFDLGARSMTVVQALTELRRHGFSQLTAAQIYEHPSIAGLSAVLTGMPVREDREPSARERGELQRAALSRFRPQEGMRS